MKYNTCLSNYYSTSQLVIYWLAKLKKVNHLPSKQQLRDSILTYVMTYDFQYCIKTNLTKQFLYLPKLLTLSPRGLNHIHLYISLSLNTMFQK